MFLSMFLLLILRLEKNVYPIYYLFPKGICLKVNVLARLEYELAFYDSAVHRLNHYTTSPPSTVSPTRPGIKHPI